MDWKVPLFDLDVGHQEVEALRKVLESQWISMGPVTQKLEERFAEAHHARHGIAVSSATAALHLALKTLDIAPGDEVICPSLTFVATANAVLYVGATPVFADVCSPKLPTISVSSIAKMITPRTRAIIVMHYAGFPSDMDPIIELAQRHDCAIVEDAAHAPLSEYKGRKIGTLGQIGCFSFFSNKNITSGEGGMVLTNDLLIADRVRLLRSHGMTTLSYDRFKGHASSYDVVELGYNYRLDDIRAALGLAQLKKLTASSAKRRKLWEMYRERLANVSDVTVPFGSTEPSSKLWLAHPYIFPVLLNTNQNRDEVRRFLASKGIQTSVHYPPVHLFQIYRDRFGYKKGDLPITESIAQSTITLPFYPSMSTASLDYVVEMIKRAVV